MSRIVCWFSAGAASAIAAKLVLSEAPENVVIARCDTGAEDPDNDRFERDCAKWFGQPIITLRSEKYRDTWDVWESRRYISGISGAPCTHELKIAPRLAFQRPDDIHVFGYTADAPDVRRAEALRENWPELIVRTPLIERGITKAACRAMLARAGIREPRTYALGFPNANCMPCCKATSPSYWALVRKHYPAGFKRFARLSRELGVRAARLNGERVFVDEIPADHPATNPDAPDCDFLCALAEQEFAA